MRDRHVPGGAPATRLIGPALRNVGAAWKNPAVTRCRATTPLALQLGERLMLNG
jgi:hypothetical protein